MKLVYISDFLPEYHSRAGGADWACWRVGKLMEENGVSVKYYTCPPDKKNCKKNDNVSIVPITEKYLPAFIGKYIEILKWYILQFDPLVLVYFLCKFLLNRPDIVHMHRFRFITMSPILAARLLRIPVYFSVYDYWMFCTLETLIDEKGGICRRFHGVWCWKCLPPKMQWLQKILLSVRKPLFDWAVNAIEKYIVLSRSSSEIAQSYGIEREKVSIIPLPYGKEFIDVPDKIEQELNAIIYVGWIQKRKGLDVLIKALKIIKEKYNDIKLYVIGPDVKWEKEYRDYIDNLIRDFDLLYNVIWLGAKPNNEVQKYIRLSEIVVIPEQWENMSPVIVGEAMFNERPAVGSKIGGIPDFIRDKETGLLFDPASENDLAEEITYLLENKEEALKMGKIARLAAEEIYSKASITEKYLNLYKND